MQSPYTILLAATLTALFGIVVFIVGQFVAKFMIEPAAQVRKAMADISSTVLFRQRQITNASKDIDVSEDLRRVAAQLLASVSMVVAYDKVRRVRVWQLPSKADALEASRQLNLLAYGTMPNADDPRPFQNRAALLQLGWLLKIPVQYETPQIPNQPPSANEQEAGPERS
jgi:hypothetical protein